MKRYLSLGLLAFTSCAVYVPTVPSTPLLAGKGDMEVTAAVRSFSSFETNVAFSPWSKVLVVGEAAVQSSEGNETSNNQTTTYRNIHRQAGLGLGTYRMIGKDRLTYFGAVGGIGIAHADISDTRISLVVPFFGPTVHYQANYARYYGQLYVAWQKERVNYGFSVRNTFVSYSKLLRDGEAMQPSNRFFLEPTAFVRIGQGVVQGMGTFGYSMPARNEPLKQDRRNLTPTSLLMSLGVVVRPQLLWRRTQPAVLN